MKGKSCEFHFERRWDSLIRPLATFSTRTRKDYRSRRRRKVDRSQPTGSLACASCLYDQTVSVLQGATAGQHNTNGAEEYFQIVPEAAVLEIHQIVSDFAFKAFQIVVISIFYLSQSCQTRF